MKKKINLIIVAMIFCFTLLLGGCASCQRQLTDLKSDFNNGLDRVINVYTANGELIAQYKGKIDLEMNEGGYIKFDFEGKRYIYYNCFVESIGEI